ncbi:hypothetical protein ACOSP7_020329 [Xanthoceras sorbifolium]
MPGCIVKKGLNQKENQTITEGAGRSLFLIAFVTWIKKMVQETSYSKQDVGLWISQKISQSTYIISDIPSNVSDKHTPFS